jgi:hypothetical protein
MIRALTIAASVTALLCAGGCERGETQDETAASEAALNAPPSATEVHLDASVLADQEDLAEQAREEGTVVRTSAGTSSAAPSARIEPVSATSTGTEPSAPETSERPGEEQPARQQPAEGGGWSVKDLFVPNRSADE